jgi:hypothetical protein
MNNGTFCTARLIDGPSPRRFHRLIEDRRCAWIAPGFPLSFLDLRHMARNDDLG